MIAALHFLSGWILHLDRHLVEMLVRFDVWIYAVLFAVIFAETGFVVTPFLPGDSLLFAAGALAAIDSSGTLRLPWLLLLLAVAAILGNSVNFWIGRQFGARLQARARPLFKAQHLHQAQEFFARHGGLAIALSRFIPVVRTFTPFAAGLSRMDTLAFQRYNLLGGVSWIGLFLCAGYWFGNLPVVKAHFGAVTLGIVAASLLPLLWVGLQDWRRRSDGRHG